MIPKILIFDIETAPVLALVWKVWQENVGIEQIEREWFCLSWSAKWLYESKVMGEVLTSKEVEEEDDSRIVKALWKLFDEADILVAHNGENFDIPRMNTRFILWGLTPPSPYRIIDTVKIARKYFAFSHNKLDYLADQFGIGRKIDTDFKLWKSCLKGDKKALAKMLEYNKKDVLLEEEVYLRLRGWTKSHPNLNVYMDGTHCPYCGSNKIRLNGKYATQTNTYEAYKCADCNGISRRTKNSLIATAR